MGKILLASLVLYAPFLLAACTQVHVWVHQPPSTQDAERDSDGGNPNEIKELPPGQLGSIRLREPRSVPHANDSSCPAPARTSNPILQETDSSCWIASSQAVMKAHGVSLEQCDMASAVPSENDPKDCCDEMKREEYECSRNGRPEDVFDTLAFPYKFIVRPLKQ